MYSVVLMMAMTSGGETLDCHRREHGCHGGGYGCHGGYGGGCYGGSSYGGCYGGSGYGGCYGGTYGVSPYGGQMMMPRGDKPEDLKKPPKPDELKKPPKPDQTAVPAPARIVVSLPADAKLTIDGAPTTSTSAERVLESPALPPARDFQYTLRAEVTRDGKPVSVEQVVLVRAGKESRVTLTLPQGVAAK